MKEANHAELRLLMGSVLMECLKYHYAKNFKKYKEVKNNFVKPFANHKTAKSLKRSEKYTFRELIEEIYDEFKVNNKDLNFIKYRNEVVHQGIFEVPYSEAKIILDELERSITEIILNILQFKGLYFDLEVDKWVKYTPPKI